MGFGQEMKDFVGGYTAVREIGLKKDALALQKQQIEDLKVAREAEMAMDEKKLALEEKRMGMSAQRAALAAGARGEKAEAAAAEAVYNGLVIPEEPYEEPQDEPLPLYYNGGSVGGEREDKGPRGGEGPRAWDTMEQSSASQGEAIPTGNIAQRSTAPVASSAGQTLQRSAIPTAIPTAAPTAAPSVSSEPEQPEQPEQPANPEAVAAVVGGAQEAASVAAPALIEEMKEQPAAVGPGASEDRMNIVTGEGGLSPQEWQELVQTIDPNGSIPSYLKSAAVLSSTYKYFMEHGQPEKAAKIAKGILVTNKQMTQTLGALAQHAMEGGDIDGAVKLVNDSTNMFPSGKNIKISTGEGGVTYTVIEDGQEPITGNLTTDEFWELAGKVKDGSLYLEEMGRFASAYGGGASQSKEGALGAVAQSYVTAMTAKEAYQAAIDDGVAGEELESLRAAAADAVAKHDGLNANAMKLGVERTDIDAARKNALEMAIPPAPTATTAAGDSGGTASWLPPTPGGMLLGAATGAYNAITGGSMPAPKTKEDYDKLESGVEFVDIEGNVRKKP